MLLQGKIDCHWQPAFRGVAFPAFWGAIKFKVEFLKAEKVIKWILKRPKIEQKINPASWSVRINLKNLETFIQYFEIYSNKLWFCPTNFHADCLITCKLINSNIATIFKNNWNIFIFGFQHFFILLFLF